MSVILSNKGIEILVDPADLDRLSEYHWFLNNSGYAFGKKRVGRLGRKPGVKRYQQTPTAMHRLILNAPSNTQVDHINGNRLDNRRENLRLCTSHDNHGNLRTATRTSKYKGVAMHSCGKWQVHIRKGKYQQYIGLFSDEYDAATAYNFAAEEYFGEFSRYNLPC